MQHKNIKKNSEIYTILDNRLHEFFFFIELTETYILIEVKKIQRRCIKINAGLNEILTPCVSLNEHD